MVLSASIHEKPFTHSRKGESGRWGRSHKHKIEYTIRLERRGGKKKKGKQKSIAGTKWEGRCLVHYRENPGGEKRPLLEILTGRRKGEGRGARNFKKKGTRINIGGWGKRGNWKRRGIQPRFTGMLQPRRGGERERSNRALVEIPPYAIITGGGNRSGQVRI